MSARRLDGRPDAGALSPLGLPRPLAVRANPDGEPCEVQRPARRGAAAASLAIERIEETWRVVDEWWRETPLRRTYYRVTLAGGASLTLFHDDTQPRGEGWYEQRY
ncbi:MAG: hypothetical protein F4X26_04780 [Chloroflexi bacterium]|nr:hypothetical protein [Chloroflexota bacterium]MYD65283.1 hypothetical protein [Chloroflexota bacterium]